MKSKSEFRVKTVLFESQMEDINYNFKMIKVQNPKTKTLRSISKKANVSIATASRVLSGAKTAVKISEKTRNRVLKVAKGIDYHPNIFARSLRLRKSFTVGLVVSSIEDYFFGPIIKGVERILRSKGYHLILVDAENNSEKELFCIQDLFSRMVDGILIAGIPAGYGKEGLLHLAEKDIPVVCIARQIDGNLPWIAVDNELGGFLATEHLIMLGHKRIGFISGPPKQPDCQSRLAGYRAAFTKHGLKFNKDLIVIVKDASPLPETGYKAIMKEFSHRQMNMTACFAYNDFMALGAMKAIATKGRKVPQDFSIVGFDDILLASYCLPSLTTVRQPLEEMGKKAASLLMNIILKQNIDDKEKKIVLPPNLIVRNSTTGIAV